MKCLSVFLLVLKLSAQSSIQFQTSRRPETGAVARSVQDKLNESVSLKDFGAVGDGVADDTLAFRAAMTAAGIGSRALYIPAGTYSVDTISNFASNVGCKIFGEGTGASFVKSRYGNDVFYIAGINAQEMVFEDFSIQGSGVVITRATASIAIGSQVVTPSSMAGVRLGSLLTVTNADGSNPENVTVSALSGTTFTATFISTKTASTVDTVRGTTPGIEIIVNAGHGIHVGATGIAAVNWRMSRLKFFNMGGSGFKSDGGPNPFSSSMRDCLFTDIAGDGVTADQVMLLEMDTIYFASFHGTNSAGIRVVSGGVKLNNVNGINGGRGQKYWGIFGTSSPLRSVSLQMDYCNVESFLSIGIWLLGGSHANIEATSFVHGDSNAVQAIRYEDDLRRYGLPNDGTLDELTTFITGTSLKNPAASWLHGTPIHIKAGTPPLVKGHNQYQPSEYWDDTAGVLRQLPVLIVDGTPSGAGYAVHTNSLIIDNRSASGLDRPYPVNVSIMSDVTDQGTIHPFDIYRGHGSSPIASIDKDGKALFSSLISGAGSIDAAGKAVLSELTLAPWHIDANGVDSLLRIQKGHGLPSHTPNVSPVLSLLHYAEGESFLATGPAGELLIGASGGMVNFLDATLAANAQIKILKTGDVTLANGKLSAPSNTGSDIVTTDGTQTISHKDFRSPSNVFPTGLSAVTSVAGRTGVVVLTTADFAGTTLAAQEPAHTGDVTNTAGSLAMTLKRLTPTNTPPVCAVTGDVGNLWLDNTSPVTTHLKICSEVASMATFVTVF